MKAIPKQIPRRPAPPPPARIRFLRGHLSVPTAGNSAVKRQHPGKRYFCLILLGNILRLADGAQDCIAIDQKLWFERLDFGVLAIWPQFLLEVFLRGGLSGGRIE
ncbi:hypothetical protein WKW52_03895 [Bradyrhizobium ottawaense]|uniref:hypothetical protein n=1 Tax=Bradyrhizobium ottawaense TaxID=931866 RepID=UPI00313F1285